MFVQEEKLIKALISRGLLTREEIEDYRRAHPTGAGSTDEFLTQLVQSGYLTVRQARRTARDFQTLTHQQIPGFQLLEKLGQGSMGTVFKSRQLSMDRLVAVKVLQPHLVDNPAYLQRFHREARIAAKLSSNNIVQAIDVGSAGAIHYFVMEYVEGTTIQDQLQGGKIFSEREALGIIVQVAQALEHAHGRGLVHRDVKPANIMMTKDGIAKLADLGMSRPIRDRELDEQERGKIIGTPYYVAPELIRGKVEADIRADIYSLGATLYHMVTGRPPFKHEKVSHVLQAHLEDELVPPDHINRSLSAGLGEVVELMMARNRDERYRTPGDLIIDLECLLRGEAPKIARKRARYGLLEHLTDGPVAREDVSYTPIHSHVPAGASGILAIILGVLLGLSVLVNLVLLLQQR